MFCPQCATENSQETLYCRQCGQALAAVRLAVEGLTKQSAQRLEAGVQWMNGGIATLLSFSLVAVILTIVGVGAGNPSLSIIAMINEVAGVLIGIPLVFAGRVSMKRAARLLSPKDSQPRAPALDTKASPLLSTNLNSTQMRFPAPGSVTENTTLNLRPKD